MKSYQNMDKHTLEEILNESQKRYNSFKSMNLKLDMSRGKPGKEQLDLSEEYLQVLSENCDCYSEDNTDCRNYGLPDGLPEMKKMFGDMLEVPAENIIVGGNSSLAMMYDTLARDMMFGNADSEKPWSKLDKIKFLCPVPGYDRHFLVTETLGFEMINVKMNPDGPDMDEVERLAGSDPAVKGIWCVPKYSNPDGITYSDEVVKRLASMKTAAPDFRIMYDNAYTVHHLYADKEDKLLNIMDECIKYGNENRIYMYGSTSKIIYPGGGVAAIASSAANISHIRKLISVQTIGPDKLNQLRHIKYFKDINGIREQMKKFVKILQPKFQNTLDILDKELSSSGAAHWNKPNGGYFISLFIMDGCAKETVKLAKECGVVFTPAGATYPYGKDPDDSNIRIAPTYPPLDELKTAIEILCICVKIATLNKILGNR